MTRTQGGFQVWRFRRWDSADRVVLLAATALIEWPGRGILVITTIPQITDQMRQALEAEPGGPVQIVDEQTKRVYYVISGEQFETVRAMYDDGDFQPREMYPLISKTAAEAGWDDPLMDEYDNYDEHRHES